MLKELKCPLINKSCIKDKCSWWIELLAKNEQTGKTENVSGCVVVKTFDVQLDTAKRSEGIQKGVESLRNETVTRTNSALGLIANKMKALT